MRDTRYDGGRQACGDFPRGFVVALHLSEVNPSLTAVKREKFAKNKKTTSKERLSLLLFKVCYFTSILLIY